MLVRMKDGIMYFTPQRTLMCILELSTHTRIGGRLDRGSVDRLYRSNHGEVPSLASSRANRVDKAYCEGYIGEDATLWLWWGRELLVDWSFNIM